MKRFMRRNRLVREIAYTLIVLAKLVLVLKDLVGPALNYSGSDDEKLLSKNSSGRRQVCV
jgi:hypothetical protein